MGKSGKFAKQWIEQPLYEVILKTYSDSAIERNWDSLLLIAELFYQNQKKLATGLNFILNIEEAENSTAYLKRIRENKLGSP